MNSKQRRRAARILPILSFHYDMNEDGYAMIAAKFQIPVMKVSLPDMEDAMGKLAATNKSIGDMTLRGLTSNQHKP